MKDLASALRCTAFASDMAAKERNCKPAPSAHAAPSAKAHLQLGTYLRHAISRPGPATCTY